MLIKPMLEREPRASGLVSLSAVGPITSGSAANDGRGYSDAMVRHLRRQRRLERAASPVIGGWTVRMW